MDEHLAVIKYLSREYIVPRLAQRPPYNSFLNGHMREEWHAQLKNLTECVATAKFLFAKTWGAESSSEVLQPAEMLRFLDKASTGLDFHNSVAKTVGLFLCLDSHYDTIVKAMKPEFFPESEKEILKQLGYENPEDDLTAIIVILRERALRSPRTAENSVSVQLEATEHHLQEEKKAARLALQSKDVKDCFLRRPKWWKGIGQVTQGAALSIANLALALDILSLPVSPETKSYGAIVSATTGIGQVLSGIGDIMGE